MLGPSSSTDGVNPDEDKAQAEECLRASIQHQLDHLDTLPAQTSLKLHPLQWWQSRAFEMPDVARVARFLLGIPGSTASVDDGRGWLPTWELEFCTAMKTSRGVSQVKSFFQKRLRSAKAELPDAGK